MFRRLVVLLDGMAPRRGAFLHALDWAERLHVPIHGIEVPSRGDALAHLATDRPMEATSLPSLSSADAERACADLCAAHRLPWQLSREQRDLADVIRSRIQAADLLVISRGTTAPERQKLVRQAVHSRPAAMLLCADGYSQASRVLVLDDGGDAGYLETAATVCQTLSARPVVLTVARSERAARRRQANAMAALADTDVGADFDAVIGSDVHTAVTHVARWRRCPLVILRRPELPAWRRWLGDPRAELLLDGHPELSYLALSSAVRARPHDRAVDTPDRPGRLADSR